MHHPNFRAVNTHLTDDEVKALREGLVWPKDKQVFSPYMPSTSGYTQAKVPNINLPSSCGRQQQSHVRKPTVIPIHMVAAIWEARFGKEPASSRLTVTQLEALLGSSKYQASHLMSNIPPSTMGINPHFMGLEPGEVNRSRRNCVLTHSLLQYLDKHRAEAISLDAKREKWQKQGNFTADTSTSNIKFKCVDTDMHNPPCMGWDFSRGSPKLPKKLMETWAMHVRQLRANELHRLQEKYRVQQMTPRQRSMDIIKKHKEAIRKEERKIRAMGGA